MGIHPKTMAALPMAVVVDPVVPPPRNNEGETEQARPDGFYEYVPEVFPAAQPACTSSSLTTAARQQALLERIRAKQQLACSAPVTPTFAQMGICECDSYACTCGRVAAYGAAWDDSGWESSVSCRGPDPWGPCATGVRGR